MYQEPAFDLERLARDGARVTAQALPSKHSMAGDDDRQGIGPAGVTDNACARAQHAGKLSVATSRARR